MILSLSHLKGGLVNGNINRDKFNGRWFTLCFPVIDDIVNEIFKDPENILILRLMWLTPLETCKLIQ